MQDKQGQYKVSIGIEALNCNTVAILGLAPDSIGCVCIKRILLPSSGSESEFISNLTKALLTGSQPRAGLRFLSPSTFISILTCLAGGTILNIGTL